MEKIKSILQNRSLLLFLTLATGVTLRFIFPFDIEFKHDEAETMWYIERYRTGEYTFPWVGQPSSNGLYHPAFGIWLYLIPAMLFGIESPVGIATITEIFNSLALILFLWFALKKVEPENRNAWLWAFAIVAVNPLCVLLERKIWHPSLLPFFILLFIIAWWHRERKWLGAFSWGFLGALIGQIHLAGYFFTISLLVWTYWFDLKKTLVSWKHWFFGSTIAALPLIPWLLYVVQNGSNNPMSFKIHRWFMFKYWNYWWRNSFGWNSKYPLGYDLYEFYRWPIVDGAATYLVSVLHIGLVALMLYSILLAFRYCKKNYKNWKSLLFSPTSNNTRLLLLSTFIGCGVLTSLAAINVTRYYHIALYPLPFVFICKLILKESKYPNLILSSLVTLQLLLTIHFMFYINDSYLGISGDYGQPFKNNMRLKQPQLLGKE